MMLLDDIRASESAVLPWSTWANTHMFHIRDAGMVKAPGEPFMAVKCLMMPDVTLIWVLYPSLVKAQLARALCKQHLLLASERSHSSDRFL